MQNRILGFNRRNRYIKIAVIVGFLILLDILLVLLVNIYTPYNSRYYTQTVTIPPKTSTYGIGLLLERAELINSPVLFTLYVKLGTFRSLKAGNYQFDSQMSLAEIVRRLQAGAEVTSGMITIPEGFNLLQIASALNSKAILNWQDFLAAAESPQYLARYNLGNNDTTVSAARTLEGYLFPDTYQFYPNIPAKKAVEMMLNRFDKKVLPVYDQYAQLKKVKLSLDKTIILASLIEKEAGNDAEKKSLLRCSIIE